MKILVYGMFLLSPVVLLNYLVMPELNKMEDFYSNIDTYANKAVIKKDYRTPYQKNNQTIDKITCSY